MINRLIQRTVSLSLSAVLTVALLGGIERMTVLGTPAAGMASQLASTPRA